MHPSGHPNVPPNSPYGEWGSHILLEDVYLVWETPGCTRFLQVQVLFRYFYKVDYYQEFGYTVSSSGSLGLGLVGPRVYG